MTGPPGDRWLYHVEDPRTFRRGGIGVVYEATLTSARFDVPAGSRVGLKLLSGIDEARFGKLRSRSELLRGVTHPHLVRHLESFVGPPIAPQPPDDEEDWNLFYSAHVWVEGRALNKVANPEPDRVLVWMEQVAQAVDLLHNLPEGGFAHRDVHPGNIIIRPDESAALIDLDTILWGDAADTRLTSRVSLANNRINSSLGMEGAQRTDRAMLAAAVLRTFAGDLVASMGLDQLSDEAQRRLTPQTTHGVALVHYLCRAVSDPPDTAGELASRARRIFERGDPGKWRRRAAVAAAVTAVSVGVPLVVAAAAFSGHQSPHRQPGLVGASSETTAHNGARPIGASPSSNPTVRIPKPDPRLLVSPGKVGPITIGEPATRLERIGYVHRVNPRTHCGERWEIYGVGAELGGAIDFRNFRTGDQNHVVQVTLGDLPDYRTAEGARVGMSVTELKAMYGDRLSYHRWNPGESDGPVEGYTLFGTHGALTFLLGPQPRAAFVSQLVVSQGTDDSSLQLPTFGC